MVKFALLDRLNHVWAVVLIPAWQWITLGSLTILGAADTIRADIYSAFPAVPHLPAVGWIVLVLASSMICMLESSYRLLQKAKLKKQEVTVVSLPSYAEGGTGGEVFIQGEASRATVLGGEGGQQGNLYRGGAGGSAEISGNPNGSLLGTFRMRGGTGGSVGDGTGRGGKGARSNFEQENAPTNTWMYGCGGDAANHPEFIRRMSLLEGFIIEYFNAFPNRAPFIRAGIDLMPERWVNKRLEEVGEAWRVIQKEGRFILPNLAS